MSSILVINAAGRETRVALVENGHIAEFYLERKKDKGVVGNIYKGRVVRVLPGMQAAFVDIGLEKAAFLYVSDVVYDPDFARAQFELTEGEHDDAPRGPRRAPRTPSAPTRRPRGAARLHAEVARARRRRTPTPVHRGRRTRSPCSRGTVSRGLDPTDDVAADDGLRRRGARGRSRRASVPAELDPAPRGSALGGGRPGSASRARRRRWCRLRAPRRRPRPPRADERDADRRGRRPPPWSRPAERPGERRPAQGERTRSARGRERRPAGARPRTGAGTATAKGDRDEEKPRPRKEAADRGPAQGRPGGGGPDLQGPHRHQGRPPHLAHLAFPAGTWCSCPRSTTWASAAASRNEKERRRLRDIVDRLRPPGTGFIVRTVAENVPQEKLEADIRFLIEVWNQMVRKNEKRGGAGPDAPRPGPHPARHPRPLRRTTWRSWSSTTARSTSASSRFVDRAGPGAARTGWCSTTADEPIFDAYGIEQEIQPRRRSARCGCKSGGYLIIDQAEALTAIDVNSGPLRRQEEPRGDDHQDQHRGGQGDRLPAPAAQHRRHHHLRLHRHGEVAEPRQGLQGAAGSARPRQGEDQRARASRELGLVEMTRKRVRESIGRMLHEDCALLRRPGLREDRHHRGLRDLPRDPPRGRRATRTRRWSINCNAEVARLLQGEERAGAAPPDGPLQQVHPGEGRSTNYHREQYDIYGRSAQGEDHKVASSASTLRAPEGVGLPMERSEPVAGGERERDRGHRGGRNRRGRDRDRDRGGDKDRDRDRDRGDRERRESGGGSQAAPAAPPSAGADKAPGA